MIYLLIEFRVGSGYVINSIIEDVYPTGCVGIGVDINSKALSLTKKLTSKRPVDLLRGSLMSCFRPQPVFDIIFCNPPYVPSTELKILKKSCEPIDLAWAGGVDGREVIDEILMMGYKFLAPGGSLYLLIVQQNDPDSIIDFARELGYLCVVLSNYLTSRMYFRGELSQKSSMFSSL